MQLYQHLICQQHSVDAAVHTFGMLYGLSSRYSWQSHCDHQFLLFFSHFSQLHLLEIYISQSRNCTCAWQCMLQLVTRPANETAITQPAVAFVVCVDHFDTPVPMSLHSTSMAAVISAMQLYCTWHFLHGKQLQGWQSNCAEPRRPVLQAIYTS